jgi:hypothetical protein
MSSAQLPASTSRSNSSNLSGNSDTQNAKDILYWLRNEAGEVQEVVSLINNFKMRFPGESDVRAKIKDLPYEDYYHLFPPLHPQHPFSCAPLPPNYGRLASDAARNGNIEIDIEFLDLGQSSLNSPTVHAEIKIMGSWVPMLQEVRSEFPVSITDLPYPPCSKPSFFDKVLAFSRRSGLSAGPPLS